ncbi:CAAX amino terminal protease family [Sphaerochaeta pleomorpha str. Grapes]|uniref:CAAX amino terminal protease family n=1 Tax=Sphaerochaeta pleomorpha (strain ATCC BAA-1885 / DSM 22778 / Grapes) TaxID=158190 RepID=G8QUU8_SPHPG|nr:CPBP family intramembrane glutamic endopeptidase [Sphaerochaeta pleomorpha]AEV28124.1 CAAX amino terminal protease family [Sphaerochaeta pleomorpha str. Grapes]
MKYLRENKPIWHALVWVAIYVVLVNVGDFVASQLPVAVWATCFLLGCLSITLIIYLKQTNQAEFYGVKRPQAGTLPLALYLVPLFAIAFLQYAKGLDSKLDTSIIVIDFLLVTCVGFIEELLFRGFLFKAILKKGNLNKAIFISGITFGIGHIVNLARGYSFSDQLIQIVVAIAIGIVLAYCVALTGSIIMGVVFHALFNLSGTLTNHETVLDTYIVFAMLVVLIPYVLFMRNRLARVQAQVATA